MLQIHFSNRFEVLSRLLVQRLGEPGPDGVFASAQVIVPSRAVERALTLELADRHGICANVGFDFLGRWMWRQIARVVPTVGEVSPFEPEALAWPLYRVLGDRAFRAAHPRLDAYLGGADDMLRYELSCELAVLLRDYSTYREDWLEAWAAGRMLGDDPDERWQAALYRRVVAELHVDARHPGSAFIEALERRGRAGRPAGLPARLALFALPAIAPQYLGLLHRLGRLIDIDLYALNPCQEYWFEVVDRRRLTWLAARGRDAWHEEGHRLLAGWGRQAQSNNGMLVDLEGADVGEDSRFVRADGDTLLAQLQNSVLELTPLSPDALVLADGDRSLEVHDCHSLTRELEALHDYLLDAFARQDDPAGGAAPADILVVLPDLEAAAPLIDAVFGTAPRERWIPYRITGRARSTAGGPAQVLLSLLSLVASRCEASALFDCLQLPLVARRFGLDDEGLQRIRDWIVLSGIRWALDAEHRGSFGVPPEGRHTVSAGLERLFLGYALPREAAGSPLAGLLPAADPGGGEAATLGAFWGFVAALRDLHAATATALDAVGWMRCLSDAIDAFMSVPNEDLDDLAELRRTLARLTASMARGTAGEPVPLAVLRAALQRELDASIPGAVPTGSVTFAPLAAMRGLPFAIVCVLGLNDGAFPSPARASDLDLMQRQVRRGDRQRSLDERNAFLDLVLAARRRLYLSYTGRSVRDNAPLPPSVVLAELLDALDAVRDRIVVRHPLQPFAAGAFAVHGDVRVRSFNGELCEAVRASLPADRWSGVADDDDPQPAFFTGPLAPAGAEWREVSLVQLTEFFRHPGRYLLRRRIGLDLRVDAQDLPDLEPFTVDGRARRAIAQRLLPRLIGDPADPAAGELLAAGIETPGGPVGELLARRELALLREFAGRVHALLAGEPLPPSRALIGLDCAGEAWRLDAALDGLRTGGLVIHEYQAYEPKDGPGAVTALQAWIRHLALCAMPAAPAERRTTLVTPAGTWRLRAPDDARALLATLVGIYRDGLSAPVHFFPRSGWAYSRDGGGLKAARGEWSPSGPQAAGERDEAANALVFRGRGEPLDAAFERLAMAVFAPLRAHLEQVA